MVKNREELLQCANAWVGQAKADIRNQIVNFIQTSGTSEDELAYALGISRNELISIIETNNDISLLTFSKLLIATDNVLEIKPLSESPLANAPRGAMPHHNTTQPRDQFGRFAPKRNIPRGGMTPPRPMGGMPMGGMMPPIDPRTGRPLPPPPGYPMPNGDMGQQPPHFGGMPGMGRRMQRVTAPQSEPQMMVGGEQPLSDLASLSRNDLVQIISDNFWNGEIDVEEASKSNLIEFITSKRSRSTTRTVAQPQPQQVVPTQTVETLGVDANEAVRADIPEDASMAQFRAMLDNALAENPNLRDVISQYAPQH